MDEPRTVQHCMLGLACKPSSHRRFVNPYLQFSTSGSVNFRVSALKDHANSRTHTEAAMAYNKTMMSSR
jgi:hypothetical protein